LWILPKATTRAKDAGQVVVTANRKPLTAL
jgi:hypothetical protein